MAQITKGTVIPELIVKVLLSLGQDSIGREGDEG